MHQIDLVLADLDKANELADLQKLIERLRDALAVDHMIYHWVNSKGASTGVVHIRMRGVIAIFLVDMCE